MVGEGNEIEITVDVDDSATRKFDEIEGAAGKLGNFLSNAFEGVAGMFSSAGQSAGDFAAKIGESAAASAVMEAASTAATDGMNILGGALAAAAAALPAIIGGFLALAPALLAVGGAAGAAATGIAGTLVGFATLKLGLGGVMDAWKAYGTQQKAVGGGSGAAGQQAAAAAKAIENAEYSLTQAKRQAAQANKDLAKTIADEKNALIDLSLQLRGAKLDEADAAKAVVAAENQLAAARAYGAQEGIAAAQETLARAQLNYDTSKQHTSELQQQEDKAAKTGVMGSDQVVAAKQRVTQANEQVVRAEEALHDAQKKTAASGGAAATAANQFNEAMAKLGPNARAFVLEMITLSKTFDTIKRDVGEHLFAGMADSLKELAAKWMPTLKPMLNNMADAFNSVFKGIATTLGSGDFISGIKTAAKAFADFLKRDVGPAVDHILHGFAELAGGSTEPFQEIGGWLLKISTQFDKWITSASKSGQLKTFMHDAANTLHQIWDIGGNAFKVMGQFIGVLFGQSKKAGGSTLDSINDTLIGISKWLDDPSHQKQIQDIERSIIGWAKAFGGVLSAMGKVKAVAGPIFSFVSKAIEAVFPSLKSLRGDFTGIQSAISWIGQHSGGMWNGIKEGFRAVMNWVIDRWNSLNFSIPSFTILGQKIGGGSIGVGHINHMASGGAGGGWTLAGENGPELMKLPYGSSVMPAANTRHALAGQGGHLTGTLKVASVASVERGLIAEIVKALRVEIGTYYGGDTQRALGR